MKKHRLNGALHFKTLELDLQNDLNTYIWTQKQITWYCFPFHADNKHRTTPTSWAKPWLGVVCGGRTWAGLGISGTTSGFLVSVGRPATVAWARLPKLEIHSYPNTQKMEKIFFSHYVFFFKLFVWGKHDKNMKNWRNNIVVFAVTWSSPFCLLFLWFKVSSVCCVGLCAVLFCIGWLVHQLSKITLMLWRRKQTSGAE